MLKSAQAERLDIIVDRHDLLFVAEEGTPHVADGSLLLVGQLFSPAGEPVRELDGLEIEARGRISCAGTRDCWGNFALFDGANASVYREPSGAIPVYHRRMREEDVFVSDAELACRLGLLAQASADLTFAVHWLQFPFLRTRRTGLDQVTEVLPGVRYEKCHSGRWIDRPRWRPAAFVGRTARIDNPETAAAILRERTLSVVGLQAAAREVLLELSGGLDSSIVAACLHAADIEIQALNFATRSVDGDERQYARAVASNLHIPLTEVVETDETTSVDPAGPAFRPGINPLLQPFQSAVDHAARDHRGALLVDGAGGDNLFCFISSAAPVLDALTAHGVRKAARTASDIAARASCTWWEVVTAAARKSLRPKTAWKEDRSFLNRRVLLPRPDQHPWLTGLRHVRPGKREHVEALVHIQHFLDRGALPSVARLHPLMAQPLLELCLRIPAWLWVSGGRDRAVARDAFHDLLPASILNRRSKGSLQSSFHRSFAASRERMRELLTMGELARAGIIDSGAVDVALSTPDLPSDEVQLRITEMVALDLWLQSWKADGTCRLASAA